jgi:heterodisulfide reductase subunit A
VDNGLRVGVFLCDCGGALAKGIDFSAIKAKLEKLPDITYATISHDLCLETAQKAMQKDIKDKGINRVVVAACSPELHEKRFMNIIEAAGVNPHLLSMANIREQCFWVHPDKDEAAKKAMAQIGMAINRARFLEPVEQAQVPANKDVLVIGGGIVGIEAAIELSNLNLKTTLVEKEATLGGKLNQFANLYPVPVTSEELLAAKSKDVAERRNIDVLTSAEVIDVTGQVGNFAARIKCEKKEFARNFGAIILTTGCDSQFSSQIYGFKLSDNIVTQSQLEEMLKSPDESKETLKCVCFVLDISGEHSRVSNSSALRGALAVKEKLGSEVCILCKNLKVDGAGLEKLYRDCRNKGVLFIKFDNPPKISKQDGEMRIQVEDVLMAGEPVTLSCDLLVVEETSVPSPDFEVLSSILNVGLDTQGFYQEKNVHLYPVASNREGIFFAGNCHADLDLTRALTEAGNAALSAYQLLAQEKITVEAEKVMVDPDKCRFCLTCIRACPHHAIQEVRINHEKMVAQIVDLACRGCGICAVVCPAKAIKPKDWSDDQILAELELLGEYV